MQYGLTLNTVHFSQKGRDLLSGIDFSVRAGETLGLVGVNGAGKSTTLKIAAGVVMPTKGSVQYQAPTGVQVKLGFLPERAPLIDSWTPQQFLSQVCFLYQMPKRDHKLAISRVMESCDLVSVFNKPIYTLSKGNRQRVALAQAIIHRPKILILDEPTSGLDPCQINHFRQLIESIQSETAIVLSSHIMQEVTSLCDRAVVIDKGRQIGEISLKSSQSESSIVVIEFVDLPTSLIFSEIPFWQSGEGNIHQFLVCTQSDKDALLSDCLEKGLSISRIGGVEQLAEAQFLSMINSHTETRGAANV